MQRKVACCAGAGLPPDSLTAQALMQQEELGDCQEKAKEGEDYQLKAPILRNIAVACWQAAPTVKLASLDIAELRAAPPPILAVLEQIRTGASQR